MQGLGQEEPWFFTSQASTKEHKKSFTQFSWRKFFSHQRSESNVTTHSKRRSSSSFEADFIVSRKIIFSLDSFDHSSSEIFIWLQKCPHANQILISVIKKMTNQWHEEMKWTNNRIQRYLNSNWKCKLSQTTAMPWSPSRFPAFLTKTFLTIVTIPTPKEGTNVGTLMIEGMKIFKPQSWLIFVMHKETQTFKSPVRAENKT